ncbi:MAG: transglutaminase [Candidatus Melainabacteria bacterium]|nr:transglutaminase [Candidatus Melainabacteria bacterium]
MIGSIIWFFLRITLALLFYATPVLGFWLASSLAAYLGGPPWMAWTAGALLFPIVPGILEFHAWAYRDPSKKAFFTPFDRLSLRTFALGLSFIAVLLCLYPQTAFVALSTRGDWMLDGVNDRRAAKARHVLFAAAGGLEGLYNATRTNPFKAQIGTKEIQRAEDAEQDAKQEIANQVSHDLSAKKSQNSVVKNDSDTSQQSAGDTTDDDDVETIQQKLDSDMFDQLAMRPTLSKENWPWKGAVLHHAVATMPVSVETSIKSVARYIAKEEKDPVQRIKALHDYVADRVAYDSESFFANKYPPQDAETVFRTRKSVCAGYANLLAALADAINEKIIVVVGNARDRSNPDKLNAGSGHAWNAARIRGRWYLLDSCWDSGSVSREAGFKKGYRTDYLLPPAEVMIVDHFPEEKSWQLLSKPLSQGEFLRLPMLVPSFQAADLTLIAPQRAVNETGAEAVVIVKNPDKQWIMTALEQNGKQIGESSDPTNESTAQLKSTLPDKGAYRLNMFVGKQHHEYGKYSYVGSIDFVNR